MSYTSIDLQQQIYSFEGIKVCIPEGLNFRSAWNYIFNKQLPVNATVDDFKERYKIFLYESLIK
jgi:hypothetical protein